MVSLFISDLHLTPERADITERFNDFLRQWRGRAEQLTILGDLFELWLGDDMADAFGAEIEAALRRFAAAGTTLALMHGNRDFLLGDGFAARTGASLLPDPLVMDIHGRRVLLSHGDLFCTDDHDYQRLRRLVRRPTVQRGFLALPRSLRRRIARRLRERSQTDIRQKPAEIMDVNPQTVTEAMRRHRVDCVLHGHTHRPAVHALALDGRPATRIVLGDWHHAASVLVWDETGFELRRVS